MAGHEASHAALLADVLQEQGRQFVLAERARFLQERQHRAASLLARAKACVKAGDGPAAAHAAGVAGALAPDNSQARQVLADGLVFWSLADAIGQVGPPSEPSGPDEAGTPAGLPQRLHTLRSAFAQQVAVTKERIDGRGEPRDPDK
jgi:hypothetical protein